MKYALGCWYVDNPTIGMFADLRFTIRLEDETDNYSSCIELDKLWFFSCLQDLLQDIECEHLPCQDKTERFGFIPSPLKTFQVCQTTINKTAIMFCKDVDIEEQEINQHFYEKHRQQDRENGVFDWVGNFFNN